MNTGGLREEILKSVTDAVEKAMGKGHEALNLVYPPSVALGDFALECFPMAKQFRKSPKEIASKVANQIRPGRLIEKAVAAGPYVNITVNRRVLFGEICRLLTESGKEYLCSEMGKDQRVMVEYLSPNTNKPLHLGHLRNGSLGMAVANILESTGFTVIKANLINNRGVHICKSMLAWQRWGNNQTPESAGMKGDHFVGKWYVRFAMEAEKDPNLESEAREMLKRWEDGDPEVMKLWTIMNQWVYDGFEKTYERFGLKFDKFYYESDTYRLGRDIIEQGMARGIFQEDPSPEGGRGNVVFHLPEEKFGTEKNGALKKVTVLRKDETSLYMTQDLGTAVRKVSDFNLDQSIYVVGSEQVYHFQCLFEILRALGYSWADGCHHLSYGMVYLPEGKMKSREGKVVDADDLIDGIENLAAEEIRKRNVDNPLSEREIDARKSVIAMGAIKFYLLRVRSLQDIHFDPAESISFDGFTGPYCQYAYARISGIMRNADRMELSTRDVDFSQLGNEEELELLRKLIQFPEEIEIAVRDLHPSRVAVHIFNTAKAFNQFYNKHQVIHAETRELAQARLALIEAVASALKNALALLNIDVLEKM